MNTESLFKSCVLVVVFCFAEEVAGRDWKAVVHSNTDPLHIDQSSITQNLESVSFEYVLDVPILKEYSWESRRWKSNLVTMEINCSRNTYIIKKVISYRGPKATSGIKHSYTPSSNELSAKKIINKSTMSYLKKYVCKNKPNKEI